MSKEKDGLVDDTLNFIKGEHAYMNFDGSKPPSQVIVNKGDGMVVHHSPDEEIDEEKTNTGFSL